MSKSTDESTELRGFEDFERLVDMVADYLVGQPVLRISVGSELVVHFGDGLPYQSTKMKESALDRGAYQLRVMRAPWEVVSLEGEGPKISSGIFSPFGRRVADEKVESLLNEWLVRSRVTEIKGREVDLAIAFSNGFVLSVLSRYADAPAGRALWKLTTREKMAIHTFGNPVPYWSLLRTDVPRRGGK